MVTKAKGNYFFNNNSLPIVANLIVDIEMNLAPEFKGNSPRDCYETVVIYNEKHTFMEQFTFYYSLN